MFIKYAYMTKDQHEWEVENATLSYESSYFNVIKSAIQSENILINPYEP